MNTYAIDQTSGDMQVVNGQILRVRDSDCVLQLVRTRLLTVQEEWFMDLAAGLPWFTKMMGKPVNLYKVRNYVSNEIAQTNGVKELLSLELVYNNIGRKLEIQFSYTDVYGNTVEGAI